MKLYKAIYLNIPNDVTNAARPSCSNRGTHDISNIFEVKGDATDASVSDKAIPIQK